jgi:formylglycine-generating enzyme required for sulfatase activity
MGANPSAYVGDSRPVEKTDYDMIRGAVNGAAWPINNQVDADSIMGKLRLKTNLTFDLPTEAQWEYACRAGTSTALNNGMNITNRYSDASMTEVGRYRDNQQDGKGGYSDLHTKVGCYRPNAWGLYDMHGNAVEWCLDWSGTYPGTTTDPQGSTSGNSRVIRGGDGNWYNIPARCRSASRNASSPSNVGAEYYVFGFRLVVIPPVQ